ncbi:GIY-YIG nuclease family protein [Patescibacteria group bacterium]|nr:GIY-YIG nuclease family protein [Patescibacteria group bacterium]
MNNNQQIIYILINEAMPGYVKVGKTINLEQRIRSLDTTGVPLPFECFYAATVADMDFVEKKLHGAFADNRVRSNREWFEIAPERVVEALQLAQIQDVTPREDYVETAEDKVALDKARKRREAFNFKMVDIPVGAILTFTRDENIICTVVDRKNISFNGEVMSISRAGQLALDVEWPVQGPLYWEYEGETLDERRTRIERE